MIDRDMHKITIYFKELVGLFAEKFPALNREIFNMSLRPSTPTLMIAMG